MEKIPPEDVAKRYNSIEKIWSEDDLWHQRQKNMIARFFEHLSTKIPNINSLRILNTGSAGYSYGLGENNIIHLDVAETKISHLPNSIVADIHNIPINYQFDLIICVGSVINYCDPIVVLREFERLVKAGGQLILEFENSHTLELIATSDFNKKAVFVKSFYNGEQENLWYFSESYIHELAKLSGFRLLEIRRSHIISPFIYRIFKNEKFAAKFGVLDGIFCRIPYLKKCSSNVLFHLIKENVC